MSLMEYVTSVIQNVLSNRKVIQLLMFALQTKIWKRNYKQNSVLITVSPHAFALTCLLGNYRFCFFCR